MTTSTSDTIPLSWSNLPRTLNTAPLLYLLNASKPDMIDSALSGMFRARHEGVSSTRLKKLQEDMQLTEAQAHELAASLLHLIHSFLYHNLTTKDAIISTLFPADFHTALRGLLAKLLLARQEEWKETLLNASVGPPKLVDFDWRVDVKTASNHLAHMSVPTVLVDMKIQPPATSTQLIAPLESVSFELSPQALTTLLNGLEKIQTQLSGMK